MRVRVRTALYVPARLAPGTPRSRPPEQVKLPAECPTSALHNVFAVPKPLPGTTTGPADTALAESSSVGNEPTYFDAAGRHPKLSAKIRPTSLLKSDD